MRSIRGMVKTTWRWGTSSFEWGTFPEGTPWSALYETQVADTGAGQDKAGYFLIFVPHKTDFAKPPVVAGKLVGIGGLQVGIRVPGVAGDELAVLDSQRKSQELGLNTSRRWKESEAEEHTR
jgi:hypothetical protein